MYGLRGYSRRRRRRFSHDDKLLGLESLSKTDSDNISSGKESVLDRTKRLFYVCFRATKDLGLYSTPMTSTAPGRGCCNIMRKKFRGRFGPILIQQFLHRSQYAANTKADNFLALDSVS